MVLDDFPPSGYLRVSSKVLGHISGGLYRSPAGALKELIANAWDANAKVVDIATGRPSFDVVSINDNGDGMSLDVFKSLVRGGIGDSDKRIGDQTLINGRPMIGRLGIGLLAIAQISHRFEIVSHHPASQTAFRAQLWMKDLRKEILDQVSSTGTPAPPARDRISDLNRSAKSDSPTDKEVDAHGEVLEVGGYDLEEIEYEEIRKGVTITATEPTEGFMTQLSEGRPEPLQKDFAEFIGQTGEKNWMAVEATNYQRMLWELAAIVPIPYISGGPIVETTIISDIAERLVTFDFNVVVDGVRLFKPALLDGPQPSVGGPQVFRLSLNEPVWGSQLKASGYLYETGGQALWPHQMRGLLIRVRNVGIGLYDRTLLNYRVAEGPRLAWLTGELYVEEGLEDALTIGRDSFDEGHPHYLWLRKWLHEELKSAVFPEVIRGIRRRRTGTDVIKRAARERRFLELIAETIGRSVDIEHVVDPDMPPAAYDDSVGVIYINDRFSGWPRGARRREAAERLLILFELSHDRKINDGSATDTFASLLKRFLAI